MIIDKTAEEQLKILSKQIHASINANPPAVVMTVLSLTIIEVLKWLDSDVDEYCDELKKIAQMRDEMDNKNEPTA